MGELHTRQWLVLVFLVLSDVLLMNGSRVSAERQSRPINEGHPHRLEVSHVCKHQLG